jgi:hypothetical protein
MKEISFPIKEPQTNSTGNLFEKYTKVNNNTISTFLILHYKLFETYLQPASRTRILLNKKIQS